jgi:pre-mRNA-splicing factor ISY1
MRFSSPRPSSRCSSSPSTSFSECRDLTDAERWRSEILREIGAKVAEIQNEGLDEHRLRDLNDEINKLLHERGHWERRIVELELLLSKPQSSLLFPIEPQTRQVQGRRQRRCGWRWERQFVRRSQTPW